MQVPSRRPVSGLLYTGTPAWPPGEIPGERKRIKAQVFWLRIAGTIFLLIALAHLVRLFAGVGVVLGGWTLPLFTSLGGAVITGVLGLWLWELSLPPREMPKPEGKA